MKPSSGRLGRIDLVDGARRRRASAGALGRAERPLGVLGRIRFLLAQGADQLAPRVWATAGPAGRVGAAVGRRVEASAAPVVGGAGRRREQQRRDGRPASARSPGRPVERAAAHEVEMQVVDRLAAPAPRRSTRAGSRRRRCPRAGEVGGHGEQPAEQVGRPPRSGRAPRRCGASGGAGCGSGPRGDVADGEDRSSSWTWSTAARPRRSGRTGSRSPSDAGFVLIRNPMADEPGHQVRHVALALRALCQTRSSAAP